jgi:transcription-repair coupling factor (superfamily II helicase)
MGLSGLLTALNSVPAFERLRKEARGSGRGLWRASVMDAAKPYLIAALWRELGRPLFVLVPSPEDARRFHDQLLPWLPAEAHGSIYLFPEPDALPYERMTADDSATRDRLRALVALTTWRGEGKAGTRPTTPQPPLVIGCGHAAAQKTAAPQRIREGMHTLRVGDILDLEEVGLRWVALGYQAVPAIETPGTFSRRGGVVDIFPPNLEHPARVELFGDEIESIRLFDPTTQRSRETVQDVFIGPAREALFPATSSNAGPMGGRTLDLGSLGEDARERITEELGRLAQGEWFDGAEYYAPLGQRHTLLDYLPQDTLIVVDRPERLEAILWELEERAQDVRGGLVSRGQLPPNFPPPYQPSREFLARVLELRARLVCETWGVDENAKDILTFPFSLPPGYGGQLERAVRGIGEFKALARRVVVATQQDLRLSEILSENGIEAPARRDLTALPPKGAVAIVHSALLEGWTLGREVVLLTDAEVFGVIKQRRMVRRRSVRRDAFLAELEAGDYVVHVDHGIAKYLGTTKKGTGTDSSSEKEYLILQYAENDRIYVPTDQLDRITRYVGSGGTPTLTRLGTQEWHRTKKKVKDSARVFAQELLDLYAAREMESGIACQPDTVWQQEMEAAFPYQETADQLRVINDEKTDMESTQPMVRLVCGDVGFGK